MSNRKQTIKKYYDKKGKELPSLNVGDRIYFKKTVDSSWSPGQIFSKNNIPISYILTDNSNCKFVRNRKIIRPDLSCKENREVPEFLRFSPSISPKSNLDLSRSNANVKC